MRPEDEHAVRRICFDTALCGQTISPCIADERLVTDALLSYYLRFEPDLFFVADAGGRVAGYLTGCRDTRRFMRVYARTFVWPLVRDFLSRGHWHRAASVRLAVAATVNGLRWSRVRRPIVGTYPAHLHVNIDATFRGRGVGTELVDRFVSALRDQGVPAAHLSTETELGAAFFSKQGFETVASYRMMSMSGKARRTVWVMGKKIAAPASPGGPCGSAS
jgi:ribosomal protein S18 acetylase RimI-like enzyme